MSKEKVNFITGIIQHPITHLLDPLEPLPPLDPLRPPPRQTEDRLKYLFLLHGDQTNSNQHLPVNAVNEDFVIEPIGSTPQNCHCLVNC